MAQSRLNQIERALAEAFRDGIQRRRMPTGTNTGEGWRDFHPLPKETINEHRQAVYTVARALEVYRLRHRKPPFNTLEFNRIAQPPCVNV